MFGKVIYLRNDTSHRSITYFFRAITNLAILYLDGLGVPQNMEEAVGLLRVAAKKGHARAQIKLAELLRVGRGCQQDEAEAFRLYKLAADEGSASAMFSVAEFLEHGIGCDEDRDMAIEYYEKAALHGDTAASDRLIALVANHNVLESILEFGYAARAA
jgi:TPR repeat protein